MFSTLLMKGIMLLPSLIDGFEGIFGKGNGKTKAEQVSSTFDFVIQLDQQLQANGPVKDPKAFAEGKQELINAIVKMKNASVWAK